MEHLDNIIFGIEFFDTIKYWNNQFGYTGENDTKIQFPLGKLFIGYFKHENAPVETVGLIRFYIENSPESIVSDFNDIKTGIIYMNPACYQSFGSILPIILSKVENNPKYMYELVTAFISRLKSHLSTAKTYEINNSDYNEVKTLISYYILCLSRIVNNPIYKQTDLYSLSFKSRKFGEEGYFLDKLWTSICMDILFDKTIKHTLWSYSKVIKQPGGFGTDHHLWLELIKYSEFIYQNLPVYFLETLNINENDVLDSYSKMFLQTVIDNNKTETQHAFKKLITEMNS